MAEPTDSSPSQYLLGVTRWRRWVLRGRILKRLPRTAAILATYLANRSGEEGAWPSVETIREWTGLGRGQIYRALKLLGPLGLRILGTVHGRDGRVRGSRGFLGPRRWWIEEPSEAAIAKATCIGDVSAADTYKRMGKYPERTRIRSGHEGSVRSGHISITQESSKRARNRGTDAQVGRREGAGAPRTPRSAPPPTRSQGKVSREKKGGAPLQSAGALDNYNWLTPSELEEMNLTPKQLETIYGVSRPPMPLGDQDGASSAGGRVPQGPVSPSEVSRVSKRRPRCGGLTRDRSTCQYPAGVSGYCHRHEPQGQEGAMASREQQS